MRRYQGPTFASNTAGFTSGPLRKQMSSQKWAKSNRAPVASAASVQRRQSSPTVSTISSKSGGSSACR